jgi:cytochrome d ubiquinol oxidase subunit I
MTVRQAATTSGGIGWSLIATIVVYLGLATALVLILRKLATGAPPELADGAEDPGPKDPESPAPEVGPQSPEDQSDHSGKPGKPGQHHQPDQPDQPENSPENSPELEGAAR